MVAYSIEVLCQVEVAALLKKLIGFDYLLGETFEYEVTICSTFWSFKPEQKTKKQLKKQKTKKQLNI